MKDKKFDLSLKIGAKKLHLKRKGLYQAIHKYNKLFKTKKGLINNINMGIIVRINSII